MCGPFHVPFERLRSDSYSGLIRVEVSESTRSGHHRRCGVAEPDQDGMHGKPGDRPEYLPHFRRRSRGRRPPRGEDRDGPLRGRGRGAGRRVGDDGDCRGGGGGSEDGLEASHSRVGRLPLRFERRAAGCRGRNPANGGKLHTELCVFFVDVMSNSFEFVLWGGRLSLSPVQRAMILRQQRRPDAQMHRHAQAGPVSRQEVRLRHGTFPRSEWEGRT